MPHGKPSGALGPLVALTPGRSAGYQARTPSGHDHLRFDGQVAQSRVAGLLRLRAAQRTVRTQHRHRVCSESAVDQFGRPACPVDAGARQL
jgi:hypothetical protein